MWQPNLLISRSAAALAMILGAAAVQLPARADTSVVIDNTHQIANAIATALGTGQPFQETFNCTLVFAGSGCLGSYSVPATVQLSIEFLSFNCEASGSPKFGGFTVRTTGAGVSATYAPSLPQNAGSFTAQFAQTVKIYADPGSTIHVTAGLAEGTFSFACQVTISGRQIAD